MTKTELEKLVRAEARKLKETALPEELARLDLESLNPFSGKTCIYGQMTGGCRSERSIELLAKCAVPLIGYCYDRTPELVETASADMEFQPLSVRVFSPIENWICNNPETNANLLAYLKGECKTLKLK